MFDAVDMNVKVDSFTKQTTQTDDVQGEENGFWKENLVDETHCARSTHGDQIHQQSPSTNVKRTDQYVELEAGKMVILK
jgi:Zn ribbon nucleic-acid-binding protein